MNNRKKYVMNDEDIISLKNTIQNVKKLEIFKELEKIKNKQNSKKNNKKVA